VLDATGLVSIATPVLVTPFELFSSSSFTCLLFSVHLSSHILFHQALSTIAINSSRSKNMAPRKLAPCYKQQPITDKGEGLVATENISRGTLIISESYLIACILEEHPKDTHTQQDEDRLSRALNVISKSKRDSFKALAPQKQRRVASDISRFVTNCWALGEPTHGGRLHGVFPNVSRLNHSCFPNTCFNWDARQKKGTLYALMDIDKGTELTVSYINDFTWATIDERQEELKSIFKFNCQCEICHSDANYTWTTWRANHRKSLHDYYEGLKIVDNEGPLPEVLRLVGLETLVTRADEYCRMVERELGGISHWPWHNGLPRVLDPRLASA